MQGQYVILYLDGSMTEWCQDSQSYPPVQQCFIEHRDTG